MAQVTAENNYWVPECLECRWKSTGYTDAMKAVRRSKRHDEDQHK